MKLRTRDDAGICIVGSWMQCIIALLANPQALCGLSTDQLPKTLGSHLIRSEPARLASCRIIGTFTVSVTMCRYPPRSARKIEDWDNTHWVH